MNTIKAIGFTLIAVLLGLFLFDTYKSWKAKRAATAILLLGFLSLGFAADAAPTKFNLSKETYGIGTVTAMAGGLAVVKNRNAMAQLEAEAFNHLSNYDGDNGIDNNYYDDGTSNYIDADNNVSDFIDRGNDRRGRVDDAVEEHTYTITITNAAVVTRSLYLTKTYATPAGTAGLLTDGTFRSIENVASDFTATGDAFGTLVELLEYHYNNPTFVKAFQISSTTDAGIQQFQIRMEKKSPYKQMEARLLKSSVHQDPKNFNTKMLNIQGGFDINNQMILRAYIPASTTITMTLVCGGIYNPVKFLDSARRKG